MKMEVDFCPALLTTVGSDPAVRLQDGDKKARDTFVAENLGLVHAIVRRFEKRGHDRDELLLIDQLGSRGEGSGQQEDTVRDRKALVHDAGAGEQEGTEDSGKTVPLCGFSCERKVEQGYRTGREDNEVQTR